MLADLVNTIYFLKPIFSRINEWRQLLGKVDAQLSLLYYEVIYNLELIRSTNEKSWRHHATLSSLILQLDYSTIELVIIAGINNKDFQKILKKKTKIQTEDEGDGISLNQEIDFEGALDFCYRKIRILHGFAKVSKSNNILNIRIKPRLKNIQNHLDYIRKCIEGIRK